MNTTTKKKKPSFKYSLFVVLSLIMFITVGMIVFDASITTVFLLSWIIVIPAAMKLGYSNEEIEEFGFEVGKGAFQSNILILSVGILIATWISAGTIPTIVAGGLKIITPKYFLLTALLVCSLTSVATGTSFGTLGTSGIAMMSIGNSLGIPVGITAGAVISGAFFGDKISPLAGSTNLAAAICKIDVITHIRHMMHTTTIPYILCIVLYTVIGFKYADNAIDYNQIDQIVGVLNDNFNIGLVSLLPMVFLLLMLFLQKPAIISILASSVIGIGISFFREGDKLGDIINYMLNGYSIETGLVHADELLNRGGLMSMAETVLLVFIVFIIAGILQKTGFLDVLLQPMVDKIGNSRTKLVGSTFVVSYFANAFSSSMMFTSVFVGTVMAPIYREFKLKPENLSRIIEDTATLGGPLIPWNSNAIFASQTLGVSPFEFIPYSLLCWITPIITFFYGVSGITMKYYTDEEFNELKIS